MNTFLKFMKRNMAKHSLRLKQDREVDGRICPHGTVFLYTGLGYQYQRLLSDGSRDAGDWEYEIHPDLGSDEEVFEELE